MPSRAPPVLSRLSPETLSVIERLGSGIKDARIRRRVTQAQLAEQAGIGLATVQRMERGDPGLGVGAVLEVLGVLEPGWREDVFSGVLKDEPGRMMELQRLPSRVRGGSRRP